MSNVRSIEFSLFFARTRLANQIFGTLSFSLGALSLSSDAPKLWAFVSLLVVLFAAYIKLKPYDRVFKLWREKKHPLTRVRVVWRNLLPSCAGWTFLGMIALGMLTKRGFF
ncbi:hypothetical protein ACEN9J_19550 [Variovorax sp. Varisp41]|uniref:hypothetical protein n=1 Tax=Variovorax sp. Varisp41 TaxID=3243033 RepID=UPI0039B68BED